LLRRNVEKAAAVFWMKDLRPYDDDGMPIEGFCFWCDRTFYSAFAYRLHIENMGLLCPDFQKFTLNARLN
jgi:hypothetical protein